MKKLFFLSAGLAFITVISCRAQQRQHLKSAQKTSLLWKISGKDLKAPSYLLGTIHLICPEKFLWTPAMQKAFAASQKIAFEMDIDDPKVMKTVSAGMTLPDSLALKDYFSPEDYQRLEKYARDTLNIPAVMLSRLQPFAILSMAMMTASPCQAAEPVSYEQKIGSWAVEQHKEILGLESAKEQLAIMEDLDKDTTADQVIQLLNHPQKPREQYKILLSAFLKQDLDSLYRLILASPDMSADLNTLLYRRNHQWIPEIEQLIREHPTFIAVGAGHLAGPKGVIALLKQKGYTVEPVK
ncbi:MAG TPA: TraB/GumN family protein [Edaphocola sp.]|nr:TraB/GumN family protein [Edaphocola sp.]